jgi:hypothetical protein
MGGRWCKRSSGAAVAVGPWNKSTQLFHTCNLTGRVFFQFSYEGFENLNQAIPFVVASENDFNLFYWLNP